MVSRKVTLDKLAGPRQPSSETRGLPARRRVGAQTVQFGDPPVVVAAASVVGPMEGQGPLGSCFDVVTEDEKLGKSSWEDAETEFMKRSCRLALDKAGLKPEDVDLLFAGDLLNQLTCCNFAARDLNIPYYGLFNACATFTEGLSLAGMALDGGYAVQALVSTCSHNKTAERQYRFPTELGTQRPPTAQWTVTGAGSVLLSNDASLPGVRITHATVGRVVDVGVQDPFDMGSAMAPAAVSTIRQHLQDTGRRIEDYDRVVTGDLARIGSSIAEELLREAGVEVGKRLLDCGTAVYDSKRQDVHSGGSGAGCSSTVFASYLMQQLEQQEFERILLVATGALLSPTTYQQGHSIPAVAHAAAVEYREE